VAFSENPEKLGLPSIHTGYWDSFVAACQDTGTVINLHVGSSSSVAHPSSDGPGETVSALFAVNAMLATIDWLYSGIPSRFPELKLVLSDGGIGWVPMLLDRLDYLQAYPRSRDWKDTELTRSEVLQRNFWFATFYDPSMWSLIDRIGADRVMLETDYPHPDTIWPHVQSTLHDQLKSLTPDQVEKVTCQNASLLYRHPLPT
jgi:predicted TIM-barrel fold metal-dependent hydrolase